MQDLEKILEDAEEGVILFSFGSLVRVASLPKPYITMFLAVFATLQQTVIFKYEEELPEAPGNVIVRKWLPQADLIGKLEIHLFHDTKYLTIVHTAAPQVEAEISKSLFHDFF